MELVVLFLALFACGLMCGASAYIGFVLHPPGAPGMLQAAVDQFQRTCARAHRMLSSLAILGLVAAIVAAVLNTHVAWDITWMLIASVLVLTFAVIKRLNAHLLAPGLDTASVSARRLLTRWSSLHAVRTVLGVVAFGSACVAAIGS